jgi:hypothetical protein
MPNKRTIIKIRHIKCETILDFKLNFNEHISKICKKASRQLNVLKRIGKLLTRLVFILFIENQFISILLSSSKVLINLLMSVSAYERVLSSA